MTEQPSTADRIRDVDPRLLEAVTPLATIVHVATQNGSIGTLSAVEEAIRLAMLLGICAARAKDGTEVQIIDLPFRPRFYGDIAK